MEDLTLDNQCAFVKHRSVEDGILLAHEIMRGFGRNNQKCMCIKINLRKAYDSIHMMKDMHFTKKWTDLVKAILKSRSFSIVSQGRPYGFFRSLVSLIQGDPFPHFCFPLQWDTSHC